MADAEMCATISNLFGRERTTGAFVIDLVGVALIAFLAIAAPAGAAFEFAPPQTLSGPEEAADPQIVVDSKGRVTVAWQAIGENGEYRLVQSVRLGADGVAGPVQTLASMPNAQYSQWCVCPQLAVDSQDRVTVAWQAYEPPDLTIQAVRLSASGNPGPVRTLSPAGEDASHPRLAADSAGRTTVVWQLGGPAETIQSVRLRSDGSPETAATLSTDGLAARRPELAIDSQDRATVVWESSDGIQAVRIDAEGNVGSIQTLSPAGEDAGLPQVVVDTHGRATVAWWRGDGVYQVNAVRLDAGGTPGVVQELSPEGQATLDPRMAIDSDDRVTVAWADFAQRVYAMRLDADGALGTVHPLSDPDRLASSPQVAAGPGDMAMVVWTHAPIVHIPPFDECLDLSFDFDSDIVQASFIGPDGAPGPAQSVSAKGEQSLEAQAAFDPQGRPTVVWHSFDGTFFCPDPTTRVQASSGREVDPLTQPPRPFPPERIHLPRSGILRLHRRALIRDGKAVIRAVCIGNGATCRGVVRLVANVRIPGKRRHRNARPPKRERRLEVARGPYRLAGGERKILILRLSRQGRKLTDRSAPVRVFAMGWGVRSQPVLLRSGSVWVAQRRVAPPRAHP
jgi:hypothetical protein